MRDWRKPKAIWKLSDLPLNLFNLKHVHFFDGLFIINYQLILNLIFFVGCLLKLSRYVNRNNLNEWWIKTFTCEELSFIEKVTMDEDFFPMLEGLGFDEESSRKLHFLGVLVKVSGFSDNSNIFIKVAEKVTSFEVSEYDAVKLHFLYNQFIAVAYRNKNKWVDSVGLLKYLCLEQVKLSSQVVSALKERPGFKIMFSHPGYKRLAIILEKEKRYSEVVALCKDAIAQGWPGDWQKRIYRNSNKKDEPIDFKYELLVLEHNLDNAVDVKKKGNVPELLGYFPSYEYMDKSQRLFYKKVRESLKRGKYIDVEGQVGYVYVFLYDLLSKWSDKGLERLYDNLTYFSEIYAHEEKLSNYCKHWALDCLLARRMYDDYLNRSEPNDIFSVATHKSNLRLNVQRRVGLDGNSLDVLRMVGARKSKFLVDNASIYKDKLKELMDEFALANGGWFKILEGWGACKNKLQKIFDGKSSSAFLFNGVPLDINKKPSLDFDVHSYYSFGGNADVIRDISRDAENSVRELVGIPLIGEGWVSESLLYRKLETTFNMTSVVQHGQPVWLGQQHYDIWFPNWKVAVEYHGLQHFESVDFFGGEEAYLKTRERDQRKIELSHSNGVLLIVVQDGYDYESLVNKIIFHVKNLDRGF